MHLPHSMQEKNPVGKFAEASLEKPGMYLIALRAHLGGGKTMLNDVLDSVAHALPKPHEAAGPDEA